MIKREISGLDPFIPSQIQISSFTTCSAIMDWTLFSPSVKAMVGLASRGHQRHIEGRTDSAHVQCLAFFPAAQGVSSGGLRRHPMMPYPRCSRYQSMSPLGDLAGLPGSSNHILGSYWYRIMDFRSCSCRHHLHRLCTTPATVVVYPHRPWFRHRTLQLAHEVALVLSAAPAGVMFSAFLHVCGPPLAQAIK